MPPALSTLPRAHDAWFADGVEKYTVDVLRGERRVRQYEPEIQELRQRVGLIENPLLSLDFFLGRVKLFPANQPVVLLVRSPERLEAAIYLYDMKWLGMPTGYFRSFDHLTGESCVVAPEHSRLALLQVAFYRLFERREVRVAWATVGAAEPIANSQQRQTGTRFEVSSHCREHRLLLAESFEATLGRFGQHTRRNLRYYRRRAEKDLDAVFHSELSSAQGKQALEQLSQSAFQPFPFSLAEWRRMDALLRTQPGFFAIGLRSGEQWLSYLAGIRSGGQTYVLMQINHNGFSRYSLSTVLRSHFFEHEILRGQTQIKFVNGTCALFQRVCEPDTCVTVSARRGLMAFVVSKFIAPWHSAPDHALNIERWQRQI